MNRTRLLMLLALCAAGAFVWSMRTPRAAGAQAHIADAATADVPHAPGSGSDSPNAAERLQAAGLGGVRGTAELSSAPSPDARQPGLPEFFRGA